MKQTKSLKIKSSKAKKATSAKTKIIKIVNIEMIDISYSSLDSAIELLTVFKEKYKDIYTKLHITTVSRKYDEGYDLWLEGSRLETDEEYDDRLDKERQTLDWQRQQYEALKKKFES